MDIPQLPIPVRPARTTAEHDWVRFEFTDASLIDLSRKDLQSIYAFFEVATDYAFLVGFSRVEKHYDPLRYTTVIMFYR
jgi:hypothetical protein